METVLPLHKKEYIQNIIYEQIMYESFLSTVKDFAKDKLNKVVNDVKDWKDAAVVFSKVLASKDLLNDFLYPLQRLVQKQLQKLYGVLKKIKLDSIVKKIEGFFKKITSLTGWKKLFTLIALGGIALYAATKLPLDGIQSWIAKTVGPEFIENITSKLVDFKSYIGFIGPIVGGGAIIFELLQPLLAKFKEALKSSSSFATKLIKENKLSKTMKKSEFKNLIKENILSILKEEETEGVKIPGTLRPLLAKIAPNADIQKVSLILGKISKGKESTLSRVEKEVLSEIFVALIKTEDTSLLTKFVQVIKQIK